MSRRRRPDKERARKYAVLHGRRPYWIALARVVDLTGDPPPEERERVRRILDSLPQQTITFTGWFTDGRQHE